MNKRILLVSVLVLMMGALGYANYPGDNNGDMVCDDLDFLRVINNFGNNYLPINGPGDCWQDGLVNDLDFLNVINNFGKDYRYITPGEMIYIPAGEFLMGNSNLGNDRLYRYMNELPQHSVYLSGYWIGKYEVTRGEYQQFMDAGGYSNSAYWSFAGWNWKGSQTEPVDWEATLSNSGGGSPFTQSDSYPVGVSYYEAEAFCNWAGGHLPTEAQWEKAARWNPTTSHPNVYPWGDTMIGLDWDKCNNYNDALYSRDQSTPVGSYALGASPYGCMDMAGNVFEWCQDWYKPYPGNPPWFDDTNIHRVIRGGGWAASNLYSFRCAYRAYEHPFNGGRLFGFRLARD